jgi:Pvc16 N-terminal domain
MISEVLVLLKNLLNAHLSLGQSPTESQEDRVVFLDGQSMDPLAFKLGAVSVLLINVEEENVLRAPDLYNRVSSEGTRQKVNPEIRLNLYVLFVAHFKQYEESLRHISYVIRFFQSNRVLDHQNAPALSEDVDKLIVELVTLPFSEMNEIWSVLRVGYHPSALYKVKMVVFRDEDAIRVPEVAETVLKSTQNSRTVS